MAGLIKISETSVVSYNFYISVYFTEDILTFSLPMSATWILFTPFAIQNIQFPEFTMRAHVFMLCTCCFLYLEYFCLIIHHNHFYPSSKGYIGTTSFGKSVLIILYSSHDRLTTSLITPLTIIFTVHWWWLLLLASAYFNFAYLPN